MMGKPGKEKRPTAVEEALQFVTFLVGEEEYGLGIDTVAEVIRPLKITPLPRMSEFIEGVINLRGAIIPVVDLRRRFELGEVKNDPRKMRMMITRVPGAAGKEPQMVGFVVDGVREVLYIPRGQIEAAPEAAKGSRAEFISGVGKVGDRLIILLDTVRILSREERAALAEARDVHT